jgi:spore maturation protein CgeB
MTLDSLFSFPRKMYREVVFEYRRSQQLRRYHRTLRTLVAVEGGPTSAYSEARLASHLAKIATQKRKLGDQPRVVGFGARHWERYGFWQQFEEISTFKLFDYDEALRLAGRDSSERLTRSRLGRQFLQTIDQDSSDVSLAFFYADSRYLCPDMLLELNRRGIWTVVMGLDDKHRLDLQRIGDLETGQLTVAKQVDVYWTTWRCGADLLGREGANPWYAPPGASPAFYKPSTEHRSNVVTFIGQCYGRRPKLVRYLGDGGIVINALGSGWPAGSASHVEAVHAYSSSMAVLGVGDVGAMPEVKHLKARDFEVPMSGGLYLTTYNPELAECYKIGEEILCYSSFEECLELLYWIRSNPDEATTIRKRGHSRAMASHTWARRIGHLFDLMDQERSAAKGFANKVQGST